MLETASPAHGSARLDVTPTAASCAAERFGFVAGEENRAAISAIDWLLTDDAEQAAPGPIVLHGPSGVGKTHLMRGLADAWSRRRPDEAIEMITGNQWSELYAAAVDENTIAAFRRRFRECRLFVIDELHRIGAKPAAQTELIQTFDVLESRGAAVAVTMVHAPAKTDDLAPGLVARLNGGTVVEVKNPSSASRRSILGNLVCRRGWTVELTALEILADDRSHSVPEMIGTLTRRHHEAETSGTLLDAAFLRKSAGRSAADSTTSLRTIAERSAARFGLTLADLKSESRRRTIVAARDTAMLLARRMTKKSLLEIGAYFGGRDHTTVMHACRKAEAALDHDAEARRTFVELQQALERI